MRMMENRDYKVNYFIDFSIPVKEMFLSEIFNLVKNGKWKNEIEQMRFAKQIGKDKKYDELKEGLHSFTPSATFDGKRAKNTILEYSRIMSLDYDNLPIEDVNELKDKVIEDKYTLGCFISPSGNGLKVFVKIDSEQNHHLTAFHQVLEHYNKKLGFDADKNCKDISRLCYMSYDSDLFYNPSSDIFQVSISEMDSPIESESVREIADSKIVKGGRNNYLTKVCGRLNRSGMAKESILAALLEENKNKFYKPLDEDEIKSICRSVCKYESENPIQPELTQEKPLESDFYKYLTDNVVTKFIRIVSPHSESSIMALLFSFLTCFGNLIGRNLCHKVEGDKHYCNLFICLVGGTSTGRKGTSWGRVRSIFELVDSKWIKSNIKGGLYTGEGLIFAVRDEKKRFNKKKQKYEIIDEGVFDKKLLALQTEFSSVLNLSKGESNIISTVLRDAWDGGVLTTLIKNKRDIATNAHISIIGHITPSELRSSISKSDLSNGFANRFLWVYVEMTKELPFGGELDEKLLEPIAEEIKDIIEWVESVKLLEMVWDDDAKQTWIDAYSDLVKDFDGVLGNVTSRAAPQVLRLTMILAVLDKDNKMKKKHLEMALLLWKYSLKSADYVFGNKIDGKIQNKILSNLEENKSGITKTQIHKFFNNHSSKDVIDSTLSYLIQIGKITKTIERTGGKPRTIYKKLEK